MQQEITNEKGGMEVGEDGGWRLGARGQGRRRSG